MNKKERKFSPAYSGSLILVFVEQSLLAALAAMVFDGGLLGNILACSLGGFWGAFLMIIARRPKNPTKLDIFLVRWGTFIAFGFALAFVPLVWRFQGSTRL